MSDSKPELEPELDRKEIAKTIGKLLGTAKEVHRKKVILWSEKVFKEYGGDFEYDADTGEKYDQVAQTIQAVEETIQPHLYFQAPKFNVTATKPHWEKREALVEAVINHEYRDILGSGRTLDMENELVVLDARLLPYGVTKTSYEVEGDILEEQEEVGLLDKAKNFLTGNEPQVTETPIITSEKGHITERKNPLKIILDYRADHISKQKFIIEEVDLTKEQAKNVRYEQDKVEQLKPDVSVESKAEPQKEKRDYKNENKDGYRVYEWHDLEKRVIHTYSEQLKDFIEFNTPYPLDEGSQYSFLWFVEVPNQVYPIPPIKFYRKRALEFSYVYTQVSKQIDKFMPKIGVDGTKLGPTDKEKLKSGNLGTIFETVGNPAGAVQQFNFSVQRELFEYLGMIKELMNLEAGMGNYEQLDEQQPNEKVGIAEQNQRATQARRFKPKKRVKDFILCQGNTVFKTLQRNQDVEKFIKVLGEDDAVDWWTDPETGKQSWTKEDIVGDYSFTIDVETMVPQDEALKKRQNVEALNETLNPALGQALLAEGKQLIISPIFEKYAKENLGIKDRDQVIKDLNLLDPSQEHDAWAYGQYPPVNPKDNHQKHIENHAKHIESPLFKMSPMEDQIKGVEHLAEHEKAIAQQEEKMAQSQGKPTGKVVTPSETQTRMAASRA